MVNSLCTDSYRSDVAALHEMTMMMMARNHCLLVVDVRCRSVFVFDRRADDDDEGGKAEMKEEKQWIDYLCRLFIAVNVLVC